MQKVYRLVIGISPVSKTDSTHYVAVVISILFVSIVNGNKSAVNGVHGWVNLGEEGTACPLKVLFMDGRIAASMAGQLLPRIRGSDGSWGWYLIDNFRILVTALIQVLF